MGTPFLLNSEPGEDVEVLHRGRFEECNLDSAEGVQEVDAVTADRLLSDGSARLCQHCGGKELPTLNTRGGAP